MSNRDEHEPTGGDRQGAQNSRGVRRLGASVVALVIAIAALLVLALATHTDTPDVRKPKATAEQLVVLCPTANLSRQWAREASRIGLSLEPSWSGAALPRDTNGIAITYQRLAAMPELYRHRCATPTMVIADEAHHMGEQAVWGRAYGLALEPAVQRLLLPGTPFRSDNQPIPGVRYDKDGTAQPDFTYGYAHAIHDGTCRKVAFVEFDGTMRCASDGAIVEARFAGPLDERQSRLRHRTVLSTAVGAGIVGMLRDADTRVDWCAATATRTRAAWSSPATSSTPSGSATCSNTRPASRRWW